MAGTSKKVAASDFVDVARATIEPCTPTSRFDGWDCCPRGGARQLEFTCSGPAATYFDHVASCPGRSSDSVQTSVQPSAGLHATAVLRSLGLHVVASSARCFFSAPVDLARIAWTSRRTCRRCHGRYRAALCSMTRHLVRLKVRSGPRNRLTPRRGLDSAHWNRRFRRSASY
jgi:hypothetical protein